MLLARLMTFYERFKPLLLKEQRALPEHENVRGAQYYALEGVNQNGYSTDSRTPAPDAFAWNGPSISTGFSDRRHNRAVIQRALDPYGESLMGTLVIQQNCEAAQESAHPRWMRK